MQPFIESGDATFHTPLPACSSTPVGEAYVCTYVFAFGCALFVIAIVRVEVSPGPVYMILPEFKRNGVAAPKDALSPSAPRSRVLSVAFATINRPVTSPCRNSADADVSPPR